MKDKIIGIVEEILEKKESIKFAYIFGSFVREKKYSDIDIGIYLSPLHESIFEITSELKHKLSRKLMEINIHVKADDVDIVVLNSIPFTFLNQIFKEGTLILDRDPELRTSLIERNSLKFRECIGILKEAEIL